ncbi:hypothetical protein HK096_002255 [Nowakowskiella sp. JEL0078]|nr:hypothetical protein HK096_002255 [Nowakowskiella sp. JEL0078]
MKLLGAIDQGTSSTRFIVFSPGGDIISSYQTEFPQIHQHPGWTEHDPKILVETVRRCIEMVEEDLLSKDLTVKDIIAVGITNQRETTVVWDRVTGEPLYNAIVWLDGRTHSTAEMLTEKTPTKSRDYWVPRAGTQLTTYFSGVKLRWMLDNVDAVKKAQEEDRLMFGTVDSWLIYNLTGGRKGGVHVTDVSNASRTLLMNLETLQWDDELVEFFGTKKSVLPEIRSSAEIYGTITEGPLFGIPISGCLGDQQAALVGHTCFNAGDIKNTYGTGCFMLFNTGTKPVISKHSLITTVGYKLGKDAPAYYALEGSIAIAGAAVKWLRDNLGIIQDSSEISELASKVKDSGGVHFVPAFNGLFAPYWRGDARGCIVGISQYTRKEHLARATLEAICFQSYEV